jgi:hypothetical protein
MPGLLDYVKGYTHGGSVDFDPYSDTSQADMLSKMGIIVGDDALGLLPTYDPIGANITREKYDLTTAGLSDTLDTARRGGTRSLLDLTQQAQQKQAGTGFAGSGAGAQAMTNVRGDIVSRFGDIESDIGRRQEQSYLDLQKDIWGERRDYERDLLAAVGDLPEDSWRFGDIDREEVHDTCNEQCGGFAYDSQQYNDCLDACYGGGSGGDDDITETECPPGYTYVNGRCERDQV